MRKEENLYIRVLLWAYEKQEAGFTWAELKNELSINDAQFAWVRHIFLTVSDNDRKVFEQLGGSDRYSLNEKGVSAVVDYMELNEARESSKRAMYIAIASLVLATIVGVAQIWISVNARDGSAKYKEHSPGSLMWHGDGRF